MNYPKVSIVGRPNVGKSSLLNKITGQYKAIVDDRPGVTRDRIYMDASWRDYWFTLVDTGGIYFDQQYQKSNNIFQEEIEIQVQIAIEESDLILFLVNVEEGITPFDEYIANQLLRYKKPVIVVVNKVDNQQREMDATQFYSLGFDFLEPISALHGRSVGDLLDKMVALLPKVTRQELDSSALSISIAGRPNVGKSSILNAIAGEERSIVSDVAGTTRDIVDIVITRDDQDFLIVDTAGIRKKSKIIDDVENYSVHRSLKAISRSEVVLFVIDGTQPISDQDKKIAGFIDQESKGCIIVINKWDLVEKDTNTQNLYLDVIRKEFFYLFDAPVLFISAKTGQRVERIFEAARDVYLEYTKRVPTAQLNDFVANIIAHKAPPSHKGKRLKIYYATQANTAPPVFLFFVNNPDLVHFSYKRHLENQFREHFGFNGVPIRLSFRQR